jgi:ParB-like chromosome segregation protein Spo0J
MTGTLEHLDPAKLLIGDNVRDDAALDKQFVASVREHGVLQPITAIRTDGGIEVRNGSLSSSRVVVDPCGAAECCRGCDRTR